MEKIKFSNREIFEILTSGVHSNDKELSLAFIAPEKDLVTLETMLLEKDNVARIELLSSVDEVLKIYSGYVELSSIEKKKDVLISSHIQETEVEGKDPVVIETRSDVIYITLKKADTTKTRLDSLEETVDMLVMSALV
jgi:hypothetical protein